MTFPIEAFGDVVIVEPDMEEKTASGIIIVAEDDQKRTRIGTVIALGDGYRGADKYNMQGLRVGERVAYGKYQSAGEPFTHEGKDYLLFRIGDLVGRYHG